MNGKNLKEKRKTMKLTQTELADRLGVSMRTVQNWESDINSIPKSVELFFDKNTENSYFEKEKEVRLLKSKSEVNIPYYDVDFAGGWSSEELFANQLPSFFINNPKFDRSDFACNLYGPSVSKLIPSGAIIGLKKVYDWKTYYPTEYLYGIITKNDLRTVKFAKRTKDKNFLLLVSCPEKGDPEQEEIPIDFITDFFQVVAWAKYERLVI